MLLFLGNLIVSSLIKLTKILNKKILHFIKVQMNQNHEAQKNLNSDINQRIINSKKFHWKK